MRHDVRGQALMIGSALGIALVVALAVRDTLTRSEVAPVVLDTCCVAGAEPRRAPTASIPDDLESQNPTLGRPTFVALCANCHDEDGSGRRGRTMYPNVPDLRASTPQATARAVVRGKGLMPAFGGLIDDAELRDVVAYVDALAP